MLPLVAATLVDDLLGAASSCIPFGLGAAIYLSEYARHRTRNVAQAACWRSSPAIPTVVYGFFALTFVTPLLQDIWFFGERRRSSTRCRPAS